MATKNRRALGWLHALRERIRRAVRVRWQRPAFSVATARRPGWRILPFRRGVLLKALPNHQRLAETAMSIEETFGLWPDTCGGDLAGACAGAGHLTSSSRERGEYSESQERA